jgi:hypothetical protein
MTKTSARPLLSCLTALTLASATSACGTDEADRGGPEALIGFDWQTKFSQNDIDFLFGFNFTTDAVNASNTCTHGGSSLTAKVTVPVKYRYSASVAAAGHGGDSACFVDIAKSNFEFEVQGMKLIMTTGGQRIEFTQSGARSGLYGDWTGEANGFKLTWSMGGGTIRARAECPGGKTASTSVAATFINYVDILEAKTDQVGDESFNCSVGVDKALATYRFNGDQLILNVNGKDTTFDPK